MDFNVVAGLLNSALSIWADKEKDKYRDQLIALRKAYYDEYNKDPSVRDDAKLDSISFELCNLASSFTTVIGAPNASN